MRTRERQRGAALILLIGITAALAILTASLTMLVVNQQGATARERKSKSSIYYAEAALNSAQAALKADTSWLTAPYTNSTAMGTNYNTLPSPRPAVVYRVYDNASVITTSTPVYDANKDTKVWVEVTTSYGGRTSRVRQMVISVTKSVVSSFPKAALFSGGAGADDNIYLKGSGDAYAASYASWPATNANGVPYTGGAPYPTSLMALGNVTATGTTANLALGSNYQSLGVQANGTATIAGATNPPPSTGLKWTRGGVPALANYFGTADQLKLQQQSRACLEPDVLAEFDAAKVDQRPTDQRPTAVTTPVYTTKALLLAACSYNAGTKTYTAPGNVAYTSGTALALNDAGTTYVFSKLTVNGSLTVSSNVTVSTTGLRVTGTLGVSGTPGTSANQFGPTYVVGATTVSGSADNRFGAFWTDSSLALSGTGATSFSTLHVGTTLTIGSNTATNTFGASYVIGAVSTTASTSSPNTFSSLWTDSTFTLNSTGVMTITGGLHVGGAMSIHSPTITNQFGSTWVVGALDTASTSTSTNNFGALWVDGALTLNGTTTTHAKATRVGGIFSINGPTSVNTFGPIYCAGNMNWGGAASVQTLRDYTQAEYLQDPAPIWSGGVFTRNGGPFNDIYGDTFIVFQVNVTPTSGNSTIMCPLLATTEMITTSGSVDFGTMVTDLVQHPKPRPMTIYMVCDNDGYYTQTCNWGSTGQFYGLMVLMEAGIDVTTGNVSEPAIVGSILSIGGDYGVTIDGNAQVAYCQAVLDAVSGTLVTTTTTAQAVPGTWQELSPKGQ